MHGLYATLIGIIVGSIVGLTAEHVRVASLVQSVAAFLIAVLLADVSTLLWWPRAPEAGQVGYTYLSIGFDNLFYLGILCILAGVLHAGLGRVGSVLFPALASHRAIILGLAGALCGALSDVRAMSALNTPDLR